jgi:hypothetical protein
MPALVSALNRVDLPTLGKPTMPHFMKYILRKQPLLHIEPNVGIVEVPDSHHARPDSKKGNRARMRQFSEDFVLVLPRGN